VRTPDHSYILKAKSEEDMRGWIWYIDAQIGVATEISIQHQFEAATKEWEYKFERTFEDDLKALFTDFEGTLNNPAIRKVFFDFLKQTTPELCKLENILEDVIDFRNAFTEGGETQFKLRPALSIFEAITSAYQNESVDFDPKFYQIMSEKICSRNILKAIADIVKQALGATENHSLLNGLSETDNVENGEIATIPEKTTGNREMNMIKLKELMDTLYKNALKELSTHYSRFINTDIAFQFKLTDIKKHSLFDFYGMEKPILKRLEERKEENKEDSREENKEDRGNESRDDIGEFCSVASMIQSQKSFVSSPLSSPSENAKDLDKKTQSSKY